MARRFDTAYKTKRLDNLGDPDWHDRRWSDIDLRMHARELDSGRIDQTITDLEAAALARLEVTLTPVVREAIERLQEVGALFNAHSDSERTIGTGAMTFVIDVNTRTGYVPTGFVTINHEHDNANGMVARTITYDRTTGVLDVWVEETLGSGTFDSWDLNITGDANLTHALRTDNPHATTAEQVGAPTPAEMNTAINDAISAEATLRDLAIATATAGAGGSVMVSNQQTQNINYALPAGSNAHSVGPITINAGAIVTIPGGSRWVVS